MTSDLSALYINCTLKRWPELSHTQALADDSIAIMRARRHSRSIRAIDQEIATGVQPEAAAPACRGTGDPPRNSDRALGFGWVKVDTPVEILSLLGLSFLLFLAGLEVDIDRLRGRTLRLTAAAFALSLVLGLVAGLALHAGGFVKSPLFVAIVLVATSLGVIVPVLKDSNNVASQFGQLVIAAASIPDFGAIILLSLFFSGRGSTSTSGKLILLGVFAVLVVVVGLALTGAERWMKLSGVLARLQDTTAQIRVRGAFVLLTGFVAIADQVGLETILGAFAAGLLQATSLPFIVTASMIGLQIGVLTEATAAGLIAAGLLSVVAFPAAALALLRRAENRSHDEPRPTPIDAVLSRDDPELARVRARARTTTVARADIE